MYSTTKISSIILFTLMVFTAISEVFSQGSPNKVPLKIVIIRHGEKPDIGGSLNCKGLNRSNLLPAMIKAKFGVPDFVYVPALDMGQSTKHVRMFQTITPLAVKYNLKINTTHPADDYLAIYQDLIIKSGTVLLCWEHHAIAPLVRTFGLKVNDWPDDDFDSIWIINYSKGAVKLTLDREGLKPGEGCPF